MLEVNDLTVVYGGGRNKLTAVDRVSLAVPAGGTLGLVGESGSGKSTVARALVALTQAASGQILLDGRDVTSERARNSRDFRERVQMVFQDPFASLNPRMTIGEAISEAVAIHGKTRGAVRRAEVARALELVGISAGAATRYPHQFSGGQRQRISIARALAVHPDVLILDEVTSALDVSVQATILNLLRELQRELSLSYLFISHDLSVVGVMSDLVAVMYLGEIVELGEANAVLSNSQHPYTRALVRSIPQFTTKRPQPVRGDLPDPLHPPAGCRFHPRCPIGPTTHPERTICIGESPQTVKRTKLQLAACHFAVEATAKPSIAGRSIEGSGT
jgi:oligopeptide/dipeptide ABC transporter ATP-binding protein